MAIFTIMQEAPSSIASESHTGTVDVATMMDEDAFRSFYDRNARALWAYLSRVTGDRQIADDLLQETFYRFVRAGATHENDAHRRNSLFQIATNLARDSGRRTRRQGDHVEFDEGVFGAQPATDGAVSDRTDLARAMARLKSTEREMLWLAYGQGMSHQEIGEALGLKTASIRLLLFRTRGKLAELLRGSGRATTGRRS